MKLQQGRMAVLPEAAHLHVRSRDGRSTRVVPLSAPNVRIGRGRACEVAIDDPGVADVQCLLRRRGESWHLHPVGPPGLLTIDGRPVDAPRPVPMGTTIRLGDRWLTLLPTADAPVDEPEPIDLTEEAKVELRPFVPEPAPDRSVAAPGGSRTELLEARRDELDRWESRLRHREQWLEDRQRERLAVPLAGRRRLDPPPGRRRRGRPPDAAPPRLDPAPRRPEAPGHAPAVADRRPAAAPALRRVEGPLHRVPAVAGRRSDRADRPRAQSPDDA